jgi:hypothetical protein
MQLCPLLLKPDGELIPWLFNAEAIELAEGTYWDDKHGVTVAPQDQALSETVDEGWWEMD